MHLEIGLYSGLKGGGSGGGGESDVFFLAGRWASLVILQAALYGIVKFLSFLLHNQMTESLLKLFTVLM